MLARTKSNKQYIKGKKHCLLGIKPIKNNAAYLRGYGRQYEKLERLGANCG